MTIRSELMRLAQLKTTADDKPAKAELKVMTSGKRAELNRAADQEIGKTILAQMGGARRLQMMLGVTKFILLNNGVAFGWPNKTPTKGNYIEIRLNGSDLYDAVFFMMGRGAKKPVKSFDDVYAEDLVGIFERQTGWYLRMASEKGPRTAVQVWGQRTAGHKMSFHDEMSAVDETVSDIKLQKIDDLVGKATRILRLNNIEVGNIEVDARPRRGFVNLLLEVKFPNGVSPIPKSTFQENLDLILDYGWTATWFGVHGRIEFDYPSN
ncbi:MAG: hypothetical protein JW384_02649 [Nitrosomonadaceae bacterium]|nr:hypothetical protein [Nitrosomonadaceae bacterium]